MKVALLFLALKTTLETWFTTSVDTHSPGSRQVQRTKNADHALQRDIAELFYIEKIRAAGLRYAQFRGHAHVASGDDLARVIDFFLLTEKSRNGYIADEGSLEARDHEVLMLASIYFSDLDDRSAVRRIVEQCYPESAKDFIALTSGRSEAIPKPVALRSLI